MLLPATQGIALVAASCQSWSILEGSARMSATRLKLYCGPDQRTAPTLSKSNQGRSCVTAPLSEVLPLLADAVRSQRTWLEDFGDDEITMSTDLYEILLAYQYCRRPSA